MNLNNITTKPMEIKCYCGHTITCDCGPESNEDPEPNEALKVAKERYDAMLDAKPPYLDELLYPKPPYVSDDFQIGPDGAYENIRPYSTPYEDAERIINYFKNYRFHIPQMDIVIMSTKVADEILMALENTYTSKEIIEHYKSVKEHINDYK